MKQVKTRRVFYIPGYDPFHPRRYRELYRKESRAQAGIARYDISQSPLPNSGGYGWTVAFEDGGSTTTTQIEVLLWSDIVRQSMGKSISATYWQMLRTAWRYISTGALFRLMRLRKGPVIVALYPVVMLVLQLIAALVAAGGLALAAVRVLDLAAGALHIPAADWVTATIGALMAMPVVYLVLRWFRDHDGRLYVYYLMHDYAFTARWNGAYPPALDTRIAAFAETIRNALHSGCDEVLVIGHSSGAHVAISALASICAHQQTGDAACGPDDGAPVLSLLTLGHVVPMVTFLPQAQRLRADVQALSATDRLTWVDVTAPGDACTFALCDPAGVSGVAPARQTGPLIVSAAFSKTLSRARLKSYRWRFFRLHFQYLCAFDTPENYDYFRITAGPQSLAQRFRDRTSSKSRITQAVNRFRDMA
ncbi:hypothetical protein ERN12_04335 [Rhodobacteraceae bacterium]|nr:hypothetical protein ERN12_04335 [Paracoccaceae bacterium]